MTHLVMQTAPDHFREHGHAGLIRIEIPAERQRLMDPKSLQKQVFEEYRRHIEQKTCARFMLSPGPVGSETALDEMTYTRLDIQILELRYARAFTDDELR